MLNNVSVMASSVPSDSHINHGHHGVDDAVKTSVSLNVRDKNKQNDTNYTTCARLNIPPCVRISS